MEFDEIKKEMDKFGKDFIKELTNQLLKADKKATGNLIKSLDYEVIEILGKLVLNIKAADYLYYVDKGRKKGRPYTNIKTRKIGYIGPPTKAIIKWIDQKPIMRWKDKKGRNISKKSQAFIIARSIGKKGIRPTNIIKNSINILLKAKKQLLAQAAGRDIKELVKNYLINV